MTHDQITALTIADTANELVNRLLGLEGVNCLVADTDLPDYERLLMVNDIPKPTLDMMESELAEYKSELSAQEAERLSAEAEALAQAEAEESARLLEEASVEADRLRRSNIADAYRKDLELAIEHAGVQQKNWVTYINNVLRPSMADKTEEELVAMELKISALLDAQEVVRVARLTEEAATKTVSRCNNAIKYVVGFNQVQYVLGNIDDEGLDSLEVVFANIMSALTGMRPKKAMTAITSADFTGTIYTEAERTAILEILGA